MHHMTDMIMPRIVKTKMGMVNIRSCSPHLFTRSKAKQEKEMVYWLVHLFAIKTPAAIAIGELSQTMACQ